MTAGTTTLGEHVAHTIASHPAGETGTTPREDFNDLVLPLSPLALRELLSRKSDANVQVAVCADMDVRDTGSFPATRYSRTVLDRWRLLDAALDARLTPEVTR